MSTTSKRSTHTLYLQSCRFGYAKGALIFDELTLNFNPGWTGIVGGNGTGKSTLMDLLYGNLTPQEGRVVSVPAQARIHLCPQRVETRSESIDTFAWQWDTYAARLKAMLALDEQSLTRWETLSPGERKRWQVGAALWENADVLLLDEPTNHLDEASRHMLERALESYQGIGVLVSHNRDLLDALTHTTVRLTAHEVVVYPMPYDEARLQWETLQERRLMRAHDAQRAHQKAKRSLASRAQAAHDASLNTNTRQRSGGQCDSDARSAVRKGQAHRAAAKLSQRVGSAVNRVEATSKALNDIHTQKQMCPSFFWRSRYAPKPVLANIYLDVLDHDGQSRALLKEITVSVQRGEKIHLKGPNGSGKTSLLHKLLEHLTIPKEHVLFLPQELTIAQTNTMLEEVKALPPESLGRIYQLVAALGVDPKRLHMSQELSPGEARKLALALGMSRYAWLLVLDEPTNHMDLPSIERMEKALRFFPGAVVMVTHDHFMARQCTQTTWSIQEGMLMVE